MELRVLAARLISPRHKTQRRPDLPTLLEPLRVLKCQHEDQGSDRPNALDSAQSLAVRVLAGAKILDRAIVAADFEVKRPDRFEDRGQCGSKCLGKGTGCLGGEAAG